MAEGKSSIGFLLIISTLVIGGGVGMYFLLRKPKDENGEEKKDEGDKKNDPIVQIPVVQSPVSSGSGSGSGSTFTFPFTTELEGNKFRAFVIAKDPTYAKSIDLSATGKLNSFLQTAWNKYGTDYTKSLNTSTNASTGASDNKKFTIINQAKKGSSKATKKYLDNVSALYVNAWYSAIVNKDSTFMFANQFYRSDTGERILSFRPKFSSWTLNADAKLRKTPSPKAPFEQLRKGGTSLGVGGAVAFSDPYTYIYFNNIKTQGNTSTKKGWVASSFVTKSSSSFSGNGEEDLFSDFDDNFDITFK